MESENDLPTAMTSEQEAILLRGLRNRRILHYIMRHPLNELVHELLRADVEGDPTLATDVESDLVGMITALRPMLHATIAVFFDLSSGELIERRRLAELDAAAQRADAEEWEREIMLETDPICDAWSILSATVMGLNTEEWKRLALSVVMAPETMIRNSLAIEAFRAVLELTRFGEQPLTHDEIDIINVVCNAPVMNSVLPTLRDIRRAMN